MPATRATALVAVADPDAALTLFASLRRRLGDLIAAFELIPRAALKLHFARRPEARDPFAEPHGWQVLLEAESPLAGLDLAGFVESALAAGFESGLVRDALIAASDRERADFWSLREGLAAAQAPDPRVLKSDTSVPVSATARFVAAASEAVAAVLPGAVPVPFGHIGDGNIHFNVLAPPTMSTEAFLERKPMLAAEIARVSIAFGGSIAAEHGIGAEKRAALAAFRSPAEMDLARRIKTALDPSGTLNHGKVV